MVDTFIETSIELHKMLAVALSVLVFTYLFLRICNYIYDFVSRYTKNIIIKLIVMLLATTNMFAIIMTLIIMAEKSLAS